MSGEILFQIVHGELKRYPVLLQERMDLEPSFQPEETPHLRLGQSTCPVTLYGDGFQGMAGHIPPLPLEGFRNVLRQVDRQFHGAPPINSIRL